MKGRGCGIVARQELVQQSSQTVDIGLWRCLCSTILFWGGIPRRAKGNGVSGLPWLKAARNTKVDEVEMAVGCAHDIGRFQVTEDDGWFASVQIVENRTELDADVEDFMEGQSLRFPYLTPYDIQILLQRFTLDEVYDEVPMLTISKVVVHAWEVGMHEIRQQVYFAIEGVGGINNLLRLEVTQVDFLDSYQAIIATGILRLVDCTEAALPYRTNDTVAVSQ